MAAGEKVKSEKKLNSNKYADLYLNMRILRRRRAAVHFLDCFARLHGLAEHKRLELVGQASNVRSFWCIAICFWVGEIAIDCDSRIRFKWLTRVFGPTVGCHGEERALALALPRVLRQVEDGAVFSFRRLGCDVILRNHR